MLAVLVAMLNNQAAVITPAIHAQLSDMQAAGADMSAHVAALDSYTSALATLTSTFSAPPVKAAS